MTVKLRHFAAVLLCAALWAPAAAAEASDTPAQAMGASALRSQTGVQVCMIDTGVDTGGDLAAADITRVSLTGRDGSDVDASKHGTLVADTIAGAQMGVLPRARVLSVEVDGAPLSTVAAAVDLCVHSGYQVINWSAATDERTATFDAALQRACAADVMVFVAAGNTSGGPLRASATTPCAISVGSVDLDGGWDPTSARGDAISLLAVGAGWTGQGTSLASASAAAVAAGVRAAAPSASAAQVLQALRSTARPAAAGAVINARAALAALGDGSSTPVAARAARTAPGASPQPRFVAQRRNGTVVVSVRGAGAARLVVSVGRDRYLGSGSQVAVHRARLPRRVRAELLVGGQVIRAERVTVR